MYICTHTHTHTYTYKLSRKECLINYYMYTNIMRVHINIMCIQIYVYIPICLLFQIAKERHR